jgi:hypothetical protein
MGYLVKSASGGRSARYHLKDLRGTLGLVAEYLLDHKLKGVEGIYNQHDYFEERKVALSKLSTLVSKAFL